MTLTVQGEANAVNLTLDFGSLPSAQGWEFATQPWLNEADLFSVNGTSLTQNMMGTGFYGGGVYQMPNILDITKPYSFEFRARILDEELSSPGAFAFIAIAPSWYSRVSLGVHEIGVEDAIGDLMFAYDNSVFHDYRLVVSPSKSYELFIDGTLERSGLVNSGVNTQSLPNLVYFGDPSSGVNGRVEISRLTFQQPIPEPSNRLLMLSGLGLLAASRVLRVKSP